MESHSNIGKNRRKTSNWCYSCRKRFQDFEYKIHMNTEHAYDQYNMNSGISSKKKLSKARNFYSESKKSSSHSDSNLDATHPSLPPNNDSKNFDLNFQPTLFSDVDRSSNVVTVGNQPNNDDSSSDDLVYDKKSLIDYERWIMMKLSNEENSDSEAKKKKEPIQMSEVKAIWQCRICHQWCNGLIGLKEHVNKFHILKSNKSSDVQLLTGNQNVKVQHIPKDALQMDSVVGKNEQPQLIKIKAAQENGDHPIPLSEDNSINSNQNTRMTLCSNVDQLSSSDDVFSYKIKSSLASAGTSKIKPTETSHKTYKQSPDSPTSDTTERMECHCNGASHANGDVSEQTKVAQEVAAHPILTPQPESFGTVHSSNNTLNVRNYPDADIPNFDGKSESYFRWLRKFVHYCSKQKYPLSPEICEDINHVLDDVSNGIGNDVNFQNKKIKHYYFRRLHKILSEVMTGQMRHSLLQ